MIEDRNSEVPRSEIPVLICDVIEIYRTQIFPDKLFPVRIAAQDAVQHRLSEEISLFFFSPKATAFIGF